METTLSFSAAEYRGFRAPQARSDYRPPPGQTLSNTTVRVSSSSAPILRDSLTDAARSSRCG